MSLLSIIECAWGLVQDYADKQQDVINLGFKVPAPKSSGRMEMSRSGLIELADYEGLANTPYLDSVGVKTVSIGLTKSDIKDLDKWPWTRHLTDEQAVSLYTQKVQHYVDAVRGELRVDVKQHEFDALVSITYNIGTGNTKKDIGGMAGSTFIDLVNDGAPPERIVKAMAAWNKGTIKRRRVVIKGLVNRRAKEADLYLTGRYKNNGTVARILVNPNTHLPKYSGRVNIENYI